MKIEIKPQQIAILKENSGEIVGCFTANADARRAMEQAVSEHFDTDCSLSNEQDFVQPFDFEKEYTFILLDWFDTEETHITLTMTYAPIY